MFDKLEKVDDIEYIRVNNSRRKRSMNDYTIRTMDVSEHRLIYKHIKQDFPVGEYPPYEILSRQLQEGLQEGLVLCSGK